jgi:hypothetical protein
MAAMVDQVTSGGIERSMGDMLLEQVAEAEKNYREGTDHGGGSEPPER